MIKSDNLKCKAKVRVWPWILIQPTSVILSNATALNPRLRGQEIIAIQKHGRLLVSSTTVSLVHSPAPWWWCCDSHKLGDKPTRRTCRAAVLFRIWCTSSEASAWRNENLSSGHASVILPHLPTGNNELLPATTFAIPRSTSGLGNLLGTT